MLSTANQAGSAAAAKRRLRRVAGLLGLLSGACSSPSTTPEEEDERGTNLPPVVAITLPTEGAVLQERQSAQLVGAASDPEDGDLSLSIIWTSDRDGTLGVGASVTRLLSRGSHRISATVRDAQGVSAEAIVNIRVNAAPHVTILRPAEDTTVSLGTQLHLVGSGLDAEDGDVTASLAWASDRDGVLGSGGEVNGVLSAGVHSIEVRVVDSSGASSADTVLVTVSTPPAPFLVATINPDGTSDLYRIEASSTGVDVHLGEIRTQSGERPQITDLAQAESGAWFAITFDALYWLDPATAVATRVGPMGHSGVNALAYHDDHTLLAGTVDGTLLAVDQTTGTATTIGRFGQGLVTAGDLAVGPDNALWGAFIGSTVSGSVVGVVDRENGSVTILGSTGLANLWGIRWLDGVLYGVTTDAPDRGRLVRIDSATGAATALRSLGFAASGAGSPPRRPSGR